jgi:multidrug efflux pump subunit AcrA (membrane-fusion protein)
MWTCSPLLVVLCAGLAAAEPTIEVRTIGAVAIDSGATKQLNAPAKDLILSWVGVSGRPVAPGEVVMRFDPVLIDAQLDDRRRAAAIARMENANTVAQRQGEIEALLSEQRRLRADLTTVRASIALAEAQDPERIALLRADLRAARLAADIADREAGRSRVEREQGRTSQVKAEAADQAAIAAHRAVEPAELALQLSEHPPEEPLDLATLRIRERDLAVKIGLGADGAENAALGIAARISAAKSQIDADLAARRTELERFEVDLKQSERDVHDHTPLVWISVAAEGSADKPLRFRFAPPGRPVPSGWRPDHGQAFNEDHGWDRPLTSDELVWREPPAPTAAIEGAPPRAGGGGGGGRPPGGGGRRRGGNSGGGSFSGGLALISGPAHWGLSLPDGTYAVTVALGDDREWDGARLRIEGEELGLPARCPPGMAESTVRVQVRDGRLDVDVADAEIKAVRAPAAGVVVLQPHAQAGFRVQDPSWTLAYLAAADAFLVDALILQDLAPMLEPGRSAGPAGAPLAERIVLAGAELVRHDGGRIAAELVSVGAQSVRNSRGERAWDSGNPADNTAREIRLRPRLAADAPPLHQGETVDVALRFALPEGTTALPPHLVRIDRDGAVIRQRGAAEDVPVQAVRLGHMTVVAAAVREADLVPPPPSRRGPVEDAHGRFRGEVVPGARTRVSLQWIWGRVESLVADGSQVAAGDVVLNIYNPQMEADREKNDRERKAAIQRVLAAAEQRRQGLIRAQGEHAARVVAETDARLRLRRQLEPDPLGQLAIAQERERVAAALEAAHVQRARLATLSAADADEVAKADLALTRAGLDAQRAELSAAAQTLRLDWLKGRDLAEAWRDSVAALALRDAELGEMAVQERINTLADRIAMDRAVEGDWWQRFFETRRRVKAPAGGRILFQTGWNDQTQRSEKIGKEFPVWGGMTVAEIVDESELRFLAELPDDRFPGLTAGQTCEIEFEGAVGRPVAAKLIEIGRAFTIPRDRLTGDDARETVSNRRAFGITAAFTPSDELRRILSTGAKGWLRIP